MVPGRASAVRASELRGHRFRSLIKKKIIQLSISKIPEVRVRTSGSGSCKMSDPDPSKGSGPAIFMNLNPNLGSGSCANPVRRVREPDRGQSTGGRSENTCGFGRVAWAGSL